MVSSARLRPLTCTGSVMCVATIRLRSATGHGLRGDHRCVAETCQHSSARCGIIGAKACDEDVAGLAEGEAQVVGDASPSRSRRSPSPAYWRIRRSCDAAVEAQPLDFVLDLGQRAMGGAGGLAAASARTRRAWPARSGAATRPISQVRRHRRCTNACRRPARPPRSRSRRARAGVSDSMNQRAVSAP